MPARAAKIENSIVLERRKNEMQMQVPYRDRVVESAENKLIAQQLGRRVPALHSPAINDLETSRKHAVQQLEMSGAQLGDVFDRVPQRNDLNVQRVRRSEAVVENKKLVRAETHGLLVTRPSNHLKKRVVGSFLDVTCAQRATASCAKLFRESIRLLALAANFHKREPRSRDSGRLPCNPIVTSTVSQEINHSKNENNPHSRHTRRNFAHSFVLPTAGALKC
eukprot:Amastigsp_a175722_37.p3 type:complete len:222 gc:universal Amastigsp_a175722_37:790-125(-)